MQMAYQFPERCERLVLVSSGGLGREVSLLLRALTFPITEQLFPLVCNSGVRAAADRMADWLRHVGVQMRRPSRRCGGATRRSPTPTGAGRSSARSAPS
jgi:pimeloyl-ACP methyl ester carboxylesterase